MKSIRFSALLLAVLLAPHAFASDPVKRGPEKQLADLNKPSAYKTIAYIRLENKDGGKIYYEPLKGKAKVIGKILTRANKVSNQGYTASGWATPSTVAATAVNAIHIKITNDKTTGKGVIFSLLPKDFAIPPANYQSFYNANSSIITDISASLSIFGGGLGPCVGNPVEAKRGKGKFAPLKPDYVPQPGDEIRISVQRLKRPIADIEFENRFGGLVYIDFLDGERRVVAQVLKPVQGVGRFTGAFWTRGGRIRANHTGVIDIDTSPMGVIGGFQIIPDNHGMSDEMLNARILTQWMVIGPLNAQSPSIEGVAPFFSGLVVPSDTEADPKDKAYIQTLLSRAIVQVKLINQADYDVMPEVVERVDDGLKDVRGVKIFFPIDEE